MHKPMRSILISAIALLCSLSAGAGVPFELPLPEVPSSLTVPAQRADYILDHFWDAMDWTDAALRHDSIFLEMNLVNFFSVAPHATAEGVAGAFDQLVGRAAADPVTLLLISRLSHSYLGDPESPVRDDGAYGQMCRALLAALPADSPEAVYTAFQLDNLEKNPVGAVATDFAFIDRSGARRHLLESLDADARTLLVFFDPDCHDCHALAAALRADAAVTAQIAAGTLQVVYISPYDSHPDLWQAYADTLPQEWIVGYFPQEDVDFDDLYYIATIPSLYLLDRGGIVTARNASGLHL